MGKPVGLWVQVLHGLATGWWHDTHQFTQAIAYPLACTCKTCPMFVHIKCPGWIQNLWTINCDICKTCKNEWISKMHPAGTCRCNKSPSNVTNIQKKKPWYQYRFLVNIQNLWRINLHVDTPWKSQWCLEYSGNFPPWSFRGMKSTGHSWDMTVKFIVH